MNIKFVFFTIASAFALFLVSSTVQAQCPEGSSEVTIINPKRVFTICVPDEAIPNIGGPNDVVIPATCPCFTFDEVESAVLDDLENVRGSMIDKIGSDGELCSRFIELDVKFNEYYISNVEKSCNEPVTTYYYRLPTGSAGLPLCVNSPKESPLNYCQSSISDSCDDRDINEASACEAILLSLTSWEPWEL